MLPYWWIAIKDSYECKIRLMEYYRLFSEKWTWLFAHPVYTNQWLHFNMQAVSRTYFHILAVYIFRFTTTTVSVNLVENCASPARTNKPLACVLILSCVAIGQQRTQFQMVIYAASTPPPRPCTLLLSLPLPFHFQARLRLHSIALCHFLPSVCLDRVCVRVCVCVCIRPAAKRSIKLTICICARGDVGLPSVCQAHRSGNVFWYRRASVIDDFWWNPYINHAIVQAFVVVTWRCAAPTGW